MYNKILEVIKDKNICILGFGREGKSTYNFIRRHSDMPITIIDKKDISNDVSDKNVTIVFGDNYLDNLDKYDLIIKTPGISLSEIDTSKIRHKITSQLQLILQTYKDNVIGITGTKGKSTTSTLMNKILLDQGFDSYLIGNIGKPMLDDVEKYTNNTKLVIEMSALQLEFVNVSPHIGIILNLFEDHLDFCKTVSHYHECKMNMFKFQNEDDYSLYYLDNENLVNQMKNNKYLGKQYKISLNKNLDSNTIYKNINYIIFNNETLYDCDNKRNLKGEHNLINIMFCIMVSKILKLDLSKVIKTINEFIPLEHRLEFVATINGISYYNDSISTIPEATINALKTLKEVDTLIFGGMDRGIDYSSLIEYLYNSNISNLICMPTTGYKIADKLKEMNTNKNIYCIEYLEDAVKKAKEVTAKGKICLMSPAASSYEYFKNFEEKGRKYKELVKNDY